MDRKSEQLIICKKYQADFLESPIDLKLGISKEVNQGFYPIHGLRHPPEHGTTGWYIWTGDLSDDPNFFQALHVEHINEWSSLIDKYLGLAPGWRFLITPTYEDVWFDEKLLLI